MRARLLLVGLLAAIPLLAVASAHAGGGNGQYCDPIGNGPGTCNARKFGRFCKAEPRRHVRGMRGKPFTVCVQAMGQLRGHRRLTPSRACRGETKRRVRGMRHTPYRTCVNGGRKLRSRR